jgi:hypothetical protein
MIDWLKPIITSPLAAALATALIGALLANYVVYVFKNKTASAERKLQRQTDLAARQFDNIQRLIDSRSLRPRHRRLRPAFKGWSGSVVSEAVISRPHYSQSKI